ncbi:MAG: hypothetical protein CSB55_08755 [Candidatus Cloacimonadota bacterium]|nr:MAG: hypothetical protein CSB55_08755 [Candidatus Cloacimonadota bacterium]
MKKISILFLCLLIYSVFYAEIPDGYYDDVNGLYGEILRAGLHDITDNHHAQSYGSLWTHFEETDAKPNGTVWDMYSDVPGGTPPYVYHFGTDQAGNYNSEGDCYNREHSWPKSWFNNDAPMKTDLFHIYPTDAYVNGQRSNLPFGEVDNPVWTSMNGSKKGPCSYPGYSGQVFEPIDEYKGDFARTYFYMCTRYYGEDGNWQNNGMVNGADLKPWALNMLIEWHNQDPVSQKETDRNDAVYEIQENRNPFIDHPEYVSYIWEDQIPGAIIQFNAASYEINEDCNMFSVQINISGAGNEETVVTCSLAGGNAVPGEDFTFVNREIIFPPNSNQPQFIEIPVNDDSVPEENETFILELSSQNENVIIGTNDQTVVTIEDNDGYDIDPPELVSLGIINKDRLLLDFNEKITESSASDINNYFISDTGNPEEAIYPVNSDSSKVLLKISTLEIQVNYQISINNIEDLHQNIAEEITQNFIIQPEFTEVTEYFEEYQNWESYLSGEINFPTGTWNFNEVYPETGVNVYEGEVSPRLNDDTSNAFIATPEFPSVTSIRFYHRELNQGGGEFTVSVSENGGDFEELTSGNYGGNDYTEYTYSFNHPLSDAKIKITADNQPGHLIIDNFSIFNDSQEAEIIADFGAIYTNCVAGEAIRFIDLSRGNITGYSWDFDNDGVADSEERDPVYTFENEGTYSVTLTVYDGEQNDSATKQSFITVSPVQGKDDLILPPEFNLTNYPNPFGTGSRGNLTSVRFTTHEETHANLSIYNVKGAKIKTLLNQNIKPGNHEINWDGKSDSGKYSGSGIYFCKLVTGRGTVTRKMCIIK